LNSYEDDATTRIKDHKAIERFARRWIHAGLDTAATEEDFHVRAGPAVAMLTALNALGVKKSELVKYATSAACPATAKPSWATRA